MINHSIVYQIISPVLRFYLENKRPAGLVAIVIYKTFVAFILAVTASVLFFSLNNARNLTVFSEFSMLEGKLEIIEWILEKLINLKRQTRQFSAIAAGLYAAVTAVEAVGLWYKKIGQKP